MSNKPSQHQEHDPAATGASGVDESSVDSRVLAEVARALSGLRYGSVEITVHDGKVTQIEAKKKIRLN
ncbi:MAG: YezD family protein [Pseudomonadales bacterium]